MIGYSRRDFRSMVREFRDAAGDTDLSKLRIAVKQYHRGCVATSLVVYFDDTDEPAALAFSHQTLKAKNRGFRMGVRFRGGMRARFFWDNECWRLEHEGRTIATIDGPRRQIVWAIRRAVIRLPDGRIGRFQAPFLGGLPTAKEHLNFVVFEESVRWPFVRENVLRGFPWSPEVVPQPVLAPTLRETSLRDGDALTLFLLACLAHTQVGAS